METISSHTNTLLHRTDVTVVISAPSNPGVAVVTTQLAEQFKVAPDAIAVKTMHGNYGKQQVLVNASVYDSVEAKQRIEQKPKTKKEKKA
jgi:ribosomal protein S24E